MIRRLASCAALAATVISLAATPPAAADTDQYGSSLFFTGASGARVPCNPTMASWGVLNIGGPLGVPLFSTAVAWVDYFGIPIFVSQPFQVPRIQAGGYPTFGASWPVPSPSDIPPGQYTLHLLLQGNGQLYFLFSTVSDSAIIAPGLNQDCTPAVTASALTFRTAAAKPAPRALLPRIRVMRRDSAKWFGHSRRQDARYPKARICGTTICIQPRAGAAWKPVARR